MASLLKQMRLDNVFDADPKRSPRRFTIVVPSNAAWEEARRGFGKQYNTLIEGKFPNYGKAILERHFRISERAKTFEELVEISRTSPRRIVEFIASNLEFTEQGEFDAGLNAYKDFFVTWHKDDHIPNNNDDRRSEIQAKVIRPNVECTNGILHIVDKVFIDEAPPWTVGSAPKIGSSSTTFIFTALIYALNLI